MWLFPLMVILVSTVVGFLLEKYVTRRLNKGRADGKMSMGRGLLYIAKGFVIAICAMLGFLFATWNAELPPSQYVILKNFAVTVAVASITLGASRVFMLVSRSLQGSWFGDLLSSSIFAYMIRITIFIMGFLVVLDAYGISVAPLLTALGVGGLAVALALQDTLSNLFAGILIAVTKQVQPGDYIELESGESGYVIDISWRITHIRTVMQNMVIIPNNKLASTAMKNYYKPKVPMWIVVKVGIHLDSDLELVQRVLKEEAEKVMEANPNFCPADEPPVIWFGEIKDYSLEVLVMFYILKYEDQYCMRSEMVKAVLLRLRKEGVVIPFPIRTLHLPDHAPPQIGFIGSQPV